MSKLNKRRLVSLERTLEMIGGLSDSTRRRIPDFPVAVVLSRTKAGRPCRIGFVEQEVLDWVETRIRAHRGASTAASSPAAA